MSAASSSSPPTAAAAPVPDAGSSTEARPALPTSPADRRAHRASQLASLLAARRDNLTEAQQIQSDLEAARNELEPPPGSGDPAVAESAAAEFRERLRRLRKREEKLMATQAVWEQDEASYAASAASANASTPASASAAGSTRLSTSQLKRKKKKERAAAQKKRESEGGGAAAAAATSSDRLSDEATAAAASSSVVDSSKPRAHSASLRDYSHHALESLLRNDTASLSVLLASAREGSSSSGIGSASDPDHLSTLHALQALGPAGHPQSFTEGLHSLLARLQRQGLMGPSTGGSADASVYSEGEVEEDLDEDAEQQPSNSSPRAHAQSQSQSQSQHSERPESKAAATLPSSSTLALANIARKVFRSRSASAASIDEEVEEEEERAGTDDDESSAAAASSSGAGSSSSSMFAQPGEIELFCAMLEYASASAARSKAKSGEGDSLISVPTSSTGRAVAAALSSSVRSSRSASASSLSRLTDGDDGSHLLLPDAQLARLIDQSLSGLANWEDSQVSDSATAEEGGSRKGSLVGGVPEAASMAAVDADCDFSLNAASLQSFAHVLCKCTDNGGAARSTTQSPTQAAEAPTTHSSSASRRRSASAAASPSSKSSSLAASAAAPASHSSSLASLLALPHDGTVQMTLCHTCGMFRVKDGGGTLPAAASSAASAAAASSAGPLPVPALASPARSTAEATPSKQQSQLPIPSKQPAGSTPSKSKSSASDSSTPTPKQAKKKQSQQSAAAAASTAEKPQSEIVSPATAMDKQRVAATGSTSADGSAAVSAPLVVPSAPATPATPASGATARCSNSCGCCETLSKHLASFAQLQQRVASLENHVKQERKSLNERLRPLDKIDSTLRSQSQTVQRSLDEERRARIESDALFRQTMEARLDEMSKAVAESKASAAAASAAATQAADALAALPVTPASDSPPASLSQLHALEDAVSKLSKRLGESTRSATAHATAARDEMEANWSKRLTKIEKALEAQAARCKQQYTAMPLLQQQSHAPPLLHAPVAVAAVPAAAAAPASSPAVSSSALSNVTSKLTALQHRLDSNMAALESWKKQQLEQQAAQIAAAVVAALQAASNTSPSAPSQQQHQQHHPVPSHRTSSSSSLHHVFSPPAAGGSASLTPPTAESLWSQPTPPTQQQQQQQQQQHQVVADDYPFSDDSVLHTDELDEDDDTVGAAHASAGSFDSWNATMFAQTPTGSNSGPSLTPYSHATNGMHHTAQTFRPGQSRTLTMLGLQEQ